MPKRRRPARVIVPYRTTSSADGAKSLPEFLVVKDSTIKGAGKGMFTTRRIKKGTALGNYVGERLSYAEAALRDPSYFMHTSPDESVGYVIDGRSMENPMRWANHSTQPNAQAEVNRIGIITFRTITPVPGGREVFIDYGYDPTA